MKRTILIALLTISTFAQADYNEYNAVTNEKNKYVSSYDVTTVYVPEVKELV